MPIVERLLELTPDHRVVDELSELQLPTLSRGTTVAVYTNVTSDHLDRHGTLEGYRRVKRRLAELVDPDGALVLNVEDPIVASYAAVGRARAIRYRRDAPLPGGLGVVDGWIVADRVERLALAGGGGSATGLPARIMPIAELAIPGAHNVSNALAAIAVALAFGLEPAAIRAAAAAFSGVEHRLEPVARDRRRALHQRLAGDPARRGGRRAARVRGAGRADRRWPGQGHRPVGPRPGRRPSARSPRSSSARAGRPSRRPSGRPAWPRTERAADLDEAVRRADALARDALAVAPAGAGPATVLLSPAAASFDMFVDYAARGRAFKAAVAALAASRAAGGDR